MSTESPWMRIPQLRTRNSRPSSGDPGTEFPLRVGTKHDDLAVPLDRAEAEDLGPERPDLARREVRHRDDVPAEEFVPGVPRSDRGRRLLDAEGSEVDPQLVRRIARLGKLLDLDDSPDAHLDLLEVLDRDRRHGPAELGKGCSDLSTFVRPRGTPGSEPPGSCRAARALRETSTRPAGTPRSRDPSSRGDALPRRRPRTPRSPSADPRSCIDGPTAPSPGATAGCG